MGAITMWRKFCVAILSICLLSGAAMISGSLFATGGSTLQIIDKKTTHHYINDDISFTLSSSQSDEVVLFIEGGEIHGNKTSYSVPLQEDSDTFTLSSMNKPGSYQGEIKAQVAKLDGSDAKELIGSVAFTIYGKAFQSETSELNLHDEKQLVTYGELPPTLTKGIVTYSSDDESIITIDEQGKIKANKEGKTKVHVVVFDGVQDEEHQLSSSSCEITVNGVNKTEVAFDQAISGSDAQYRFYQSERVFANQDGEQKIGVLDVAQSGEYAYYVDEAQTKDYEVRNGELYLLTKQEAGNKQVRIYMLYKDTNILYSLDIEYAIEPEQTEGKEPFSFRYDGKEVSSVIRQYQEGKNAFQISSNQSIEVVSFRLKHEEDSDTLTISQTGNITVKKTTNNPVIIEALWQKETYELPVIIQKADQNLHALSSEITVALSDGKFEPLLEGRNGTGVLVGELQGEEGILSLNSKEDGSISLTPLKAGDVSVSLYNDGDEHYKKSNVVNLLIHVRDDQEEASNSSTWEGNLSWLQLQGEQSKSGWYTSSIALSLDTQAEELSAFSYEGAYVKEASIVENGEHIIPILFQKEEQNISLPVKLDVKIDTHAPIITTIEEREAADNDIKKFIDTLTFQSTYGTGKRITIQASDALINPNIKTSGVKEISYRVYRLEEHQDTLLLEGIQQGDTITINMEDTGVHKVCARAVDEADLTGEERCSLVSEEDHVPTLLSSNSGMILMSKAFSASVDVKVTELDTALLEAHREQGLQEEANILAAYEFTLNDTNEVNMEEQVDVVIPITRELTSSTQGTWKQKESDGTLEAVATTQMQDAVVLHLNSLEPIYYVEQDAQASPASSILKLTNPNTEPNTDRMESNYVTPFSFKPVVLANYDQKLLLYAGGGLIVTLFVILLVRSAREE